MPQEVKKVIVVAVEGATAGEIQASLAAGNLPNLAALRGEGSTSFALAIDTSPAAGWASLATGAHAGTHGVADAETCRAEYLWQAAERGSKRGLLVGFPASEPPLGGDELPDEIARPVALHVPYFEEVASHLRVSPDWDIAFVLVPADKLGLSDADEAVGRLFEAAEFETLKVVVAVPDTEAAGMAILAGPGVKAAYTLDRPVELADLMPTICYLAELPVPAQCEGGILYQALEDPDGKLLELQSCRRNYERLRRSSGATPMC